MSYKTVIAPMIVEVKAGQESQALQVFADIINRECQQGYVYHSMETINIQTKSGCLWFKTVMNTSYYMLIFYKN